MNFDENVGQYRISQYKILLSVSIINLYYRLIIKLSYVLLWDISFEHNSTYRQQAWGYSSPISTTVRHRSSSYLKIPTSLGQMILVLPGLLSSLLNIHGYCIFMSTWLRVVIGHRCILKSSFVFNDLEHKKVKNCMSYTLSQTENVQMSDQMAITM